jgi:nucleoredoxin
MEELLGAQLLSQDQLVPTSEVVTCDFVLLYFSAQWSPPDTHFMPTLTEFYSETKDSLQVVFVSQDDSLESFESYYQTMPWVAVPYTQETLRESLADRFKVDAIPTSVLLRVADLKLLSSDMTASISSEGAAVLMPWSVEVTE